MLQCEFGGRERAHSILLDPACKSTETKLVKAFRRVQQDVPSWRQAAEQIHLVQKCCVLDDQRVGFEHRLAQPDLLVVDTAKSHHRCTHAFRTEARKRLRVTPLEESCD